jgi:hypothetical protein
MRGMNTIMSSEKLAKNLHISGKRHVMRESRASDEADRRQQDEGNRVAPLFCIERGRHELPDLPENQRRRDKETGDQRNPDAQHERFGGVREDHRFPGPQHGREGRHDERVNVFDEIRGDRYPIASESSARMIRFRSSSRCSRNDIFPPSDSSSNQLSDTSRAEESFELCGSLKGTTGMPVVYAPASTRGVVTPSGASATDAGRRRRHRGGRRNLCRLPRFLQLFSTNFVLERVFQLVRRTLEFGNALAQRLAEFG